MTLMYTHSSTSLQKTSIPLHVLLVMLSLTARPLIAPVTASFELIDNKIEVYFHKLSHP